MLPLLVLLGLLGVDELTERSRNGGVTVPCRVLVPQCGIRRRVAEPIHELFRAGTCRGRQRGARVAQVVDATGVRPTTLAQRAGITKQAVSQLVRELEARDYVEQVRDTSDTRAKLVRLTETGVALRAACAGVKHEIQTMAIAKLGNSRVSRLLRDLTDLTAALEEVPTR